MKNIYLLILLCIIQSCDTSKSILEKAQTYENFRGFEPTDATDYDQDIPIVLKDSTFITSKKIKLLSPEQIFTFLNNETVLVSIAKINADGKVTYLPITLSAKNSSYKITMDYMKFATLGQNDDQGNFIGYKRIGVGLRLISQITAFESGINIGDLSSIGAAATAGKLNGTLMIEVIGIKSKEVTTILPLPSEINQSTIQNAMQALATIKSKIYDPETRLYPQVMAIKVVRKESNNGEQIIIKNDTIAIGNKKFKNLKDNNYNNIVEDKIKLQFNNNIASSTNKASIAKDLELEAFSYLFKKDVLKSIEKFNECEKIFPTYHSSKEIARLLDAEKQNLLNKDSTRWKEIYLKIYNNYTWRLPSDIIDELQRLSKQ